jgi:hypothetical protein
VRGVENVNKIIIGEKRENKPPKIKNTEGENRYSRLVLRAKRKRKNPVNE